MKSNFFFLIYLTGAIDEQTQCSAGSCRLSASLCKGSVFSLFLQSRDCGCQHLHLWHIKYEFSAHKDFIMHDRLWFSTPSALALLRGSWSSDWICHWQDHLDRNSRGRISAHSLPCSPPFHACFPPVPQGFTTHSSDSAPSSSSTKVMASKSQEEIKQRGDILLWQKGLSQWMDSLSEQKKKKKKRSFLISQLSLEGWRMKATFETLWGMR